jgi:hypothetical protein
MVFQDSGRAVGASVLSKLSPAICVNPRPVILALNFIVPSAHSFFLNTHLVSTAGFPSGTAVASSYTSYF